MAVYITKDDTFESAVGKIDREIDSRRSYGVRREELTTIKAASVLSWSNGSAEWWAGGPQTETRCKGSDVLLELVEAAWNLHNDCSSDWGRMMDVGGKLRDQIQAEKAECKQVTSEVQCLDANQIAVVGVPRSKLTSMAKFLNPLPLYAGSFEARERGIFSFRGIEVPPPIAQMPLDALDKQAIDALIDKAMHELEE